MNKRKKTSLYKKAKVVTCGLNAGISIAFGIQAVRAGHLGLLSAAVLMLGLWVVLLWSEWRDDG